MAVSGNECFEETLIINVQLCKCLYNKFDAAYHDKLKREKSWLEISEKTGKSVKDCQNRWRTLRERFSRELRKTQMASGSGACSQDTWLWFNSMLFLKEFVQPKRTKNNDQECSVSLLGENMDADADADADNISVAPPPKKKRDAYEEVCEKFKEKLDSLNECDSTDELFMKTIVSLIKDLPMEAKDMARSETMKIVMDLRKRYLY